MGQQDEMVSGARAPVVERIVAWSAAHRWSAIAGWLVLMMAAVALSGLIGGRAAEDYDPGEAGHASRVLDAQRAAPEPRENVLIQSTGPGTPFTGDPRLRDTTEDLVATLRKLPGIEAVTSPLDGDGARQVSADGSSGLVTFEVAGSGDRRDAHLDASTAAVRAVQRRHPGVRLAQAGDLSMDRAQDDIYAGDFRRSEVLSIPLTLVILVLVVGALVAATIPVLLAVTVVVTGVSVLMAADGWIPIGDNVAPLVLLFGMAVGVDYSLFYLRREREERAAGRSVREALRITAGTSGRAVVVSGLTVLFCVAGLFLIGVDSFAGMAVGTMLVAALAVLGSLTFLPAVLSVLGGRVDRGRLPWSRRRTGAGRSLVWGTVVRAVVRRPVVFGGTALVLLLLAAAPVLTMRLADPAPTDDLPRGNATVDAYARIQAAFPGDPAPARVVVWGSDVDSQRVRQAVDALHGQVAASGGLLGEPIQARPVGAVLVVEVPLAGTGQDPTSIRALEFLRDRALPATLGRVGGVGYGVTGKTAATHDLRAALVGRTPAVFAFVLGTAFLLLLAAFRSIAIPVLSILLNLLSIGAACGAVVWIFQDDHLGSVLGFTSYHGVISWLPLFMFVVLFGLSMDYHIFILTRIREHRLGGATGRQAVVAGVTRSAGVVSGAAVVMVGVFSIFATLSTVSFKMLGVGLSLAVLIDATVVRGVLLPALLALLGDAAWALPRWLRWIPGSGARRPAGEPPSAERVPATAAADG